LTQSLISAAGKMRGSSSTSAAAESGAKDGPGRDETKIEVKDSLKEADMKNENEKEKEGTEVAKAASPANYGVGVHRLTRSGGRLLLNEAV
jgi:hypothetical protein